MAGVIQTILFFITMLLSLTLLFSSVRDDLLPWKWRALYVGLALGVIVMFAWACYGVRAAYAERNYCSAKQEVKYPQ